MSNEISNDLAINQPPKIVEDKGRFSLFQPLKSMSIFGAHINQSFVWIRRSYVKIQALNSQMALRVLFLLVEVPASKIKHMASPQ